MKRYSVIVSGFYGISYFWELARSKKVAMENAKKDYCNMYYCDNNQVYWVKEA